jgi:hypothetical protein
MIVNKTAGEQDSLALKVVDRWSCFHRAVLLMCKDGETIEKSILRDLSNLHSQDTAK